MKVAFLIRKIDISEPLGIMSLSSILKKKGHETTLICFKERNYLEQLRKFNPDILAYSVTTGSHKESILINQQIKNKFKAYSLFGGPHTTFYPELIKEEGVDAICRGEGEEAIIEFLDKLKQNKETKVAGFWVKKGNKIYKNPMRNLIEDLDSLPFLDREIVYSKDKFFSDLKIKRFITSRGCPFSCTYCFNRHYNKLYQGKGKMLRRRSVDNVIKEIKEVRRKYVLDAVKFVDDTFNLDKKWVNEFCKKYKEEINLPFICNIRADLVTPETARDLRDANCIAVYIGVETGNERIRKEILQRNMSDEQIINACNLIKKQGIKIVTQNMLGLPTETLKESFETIKLNAKCNVDFPGYSIFQPYPNTILTDYALKNNFFDGNFEKLDMQYLHHTPLNYTDYEKRQLENLSKLSTLVSRNYYLTPLIKVLIKFPKCKTYNMVYKGVYALSLWRVYSKVLGSWLESIKYMRKLNEYLTEK